MIARARVGDAKTDRHLIEKTQLRQLRSPSRKIIADVKNNFVVAGFHFVRREQRHFRAPIGVGFRRGDERAVFAVERPQFDFHSPRRAAVRGVEDVRA